MERNDLVAFYLLVISIPSNPSLRNFEKYIMKCLLCDEVQTPRWMFSSGFLYFWNFGRKRVERIGLDMFYCVLKWYYILISPKSKCSHILKETRWTFMKYIPHIRIQTPNWKHSTWVLVFLHFFSGRNGKEWSCCVLSCYFKGMDRKFIFS